MPKQVCQIRNSDQILMLTSFSAWPTFVLLKFKSSQLITAKKKTCLRLDRRDDVGREAVEVRQVCPKCHKRYAKLEHSLHWSDSNLPYICMCMCGCVCVSVCWCVCQPAGVVLPCQARSCCIPALKKAAKVAEKQPKYAGAG